MVYTWVKKYAEEGNLLLFKAAFGEWIFLMKEIWQHFHYNLMVNNYIIMQFLDRLNTWCVTHKHALL